MAAAAKEPKHALLGNVHTLEFAREAIAHLGDKFVVDRAEHVFSITHPFDETCRTVTPAGLYSVPSVVEISRAIRESLWADGIAPSPTLIKRMLGAFVCNVDPVVVLVHDEASVPPDVDPDRIYRVLWPAGAKPAEAAEVDAYREPGTNVVYIGGKPVPSRDQEGKGSLATLEVVTPLTTSMDELKEALTKSIALAIADEQHELPLDGDNDD